MNDVVAVSTGSSRTYPVPSGVVEEVLRGVRWVNAYDIEVPEPYQAAAALLASGGGLSSGEIGDLLVLTPSQSPDSGWLPGEENYPCRDLVLATLTGGQPMQSWGTGIVASLEQQQSKERESLLATIGYDSSTYKYLGLCASGDPDIVTDLVRQNDDTWQHWDVATQAWTDISIGAAMSYPAVEPDEPMLAAIVAAVSTGDRLLLVYADPLMFLPEGMTASTFPDSVDETVIAAAIDDMDHTAVWSVLKIEPGLTVSMRASGQWHEVNPFDWAAEEFQIVPLSEPLIASVLAKADSIDFGADVSEDVPEVPAVVSRLTDLSTRIDDTFGQVISMIGSSQPEGDSYEEKIRHRHENRALVADIETLREWSVLKARRDVFATAASVPLERGVALVSDIGGKYHPGAIRLRRYWTRGKGAMKIKWGVHGNWTRCYRKLFKYLGPRAAGYCQLRHKETTGVYTGDKAHRMGLVASDNAKANSGAMIALVPSDADLDRLVLEGGESRDELHLTLAFLGEGADWDEDERQVLVNNVRQGVADLESSDGLSAQAFGFAHWNPFGDDPVWVMSVGGGELEQIHDIIWSSIERVHDGGIPEIPEQHVPWVPHVAVKYGKSDDVNLSDLSDRVGPVTFTALRVAFESSVTDIPLTLS